MSDCQTRVQTDNFWSTSDVFKGFSDAFKFRKPATKEHYAMADSLLSECLRANHRRGGFGKIDDLFTKNILMYEVGNFLVTHDYYNEILDSVGIKSWTSDRPIMLKVNALKRSGVRSHELIELYSLKSIDQVRNLEIDEDAWDPEAPWIFNPTLSTLKKKPRTIGCLAYFDGHRFNQEVGSGKIIDRPLRHLYVRLKTICMLLRFNPMGLSLFLSGICEACEGATQRGFVDVINLFSESHANKISHSIHSFWFLGSATWGPIVGRLSQIQLQNSSAGHLARYLEHLSESQLAAMVDDGSEEIDVDEEEIEDLRI